MSENEMEAAANAVRDDDTDEYVWTKPGSDDQLRISRPTPGQHMVLLGMQGGFANATEQMRTFVNYFYALVSTQDKAKVQRWLLDPEEDFEVETLTDILTEATEHWSGRPTEPSSNSTGSRSSTGRKSTSGKRQQTRSTSDSTGS